MKTVINLPRVMTDNEERYIGLVGAVTNYSAPDSDIRVDSHNQGFNISIEPSDPQFRKDLIDNLLGMHRGLKLKIIFSSSLNFEKANLVSFKINFADKK